MLTRPKHIPQAAWDRFHELQAEEQQIRKSVVGDTGGQEGTAVPRVFYATDNFIINPSNVGVGMLARMIETDDTVLSALHFRTLMILSKIGEYHHENAEIMDFVNEFLGAMKGPTWRESMEAQLSHTGFGFSVSEIVYGLDEKLRKVPKRIATYHPSTLAFEVDAYGQISEMGILQYVLQYTQFSNPNNYWSKIPYGYHVQNPFTTPVDRLLPARIPFVYNYGLVRIPRNKVIHHVHLPMLSFGSPYGKTPVRTAHLAWQLKVFFFKQLGIAGKRSSQPTLWATAPTGENKVKVTHPDGKVEELTPTQALKFMMSHRESDDALFTGPESAGYKIEVLQNTANLDGYVNVINNLNVWIFRCFLMPSLVMTDGSAGSRSLGDKHFDIVNRISENDAAKFGETIVNDMIERVVRENFGAQKNYGHFTQRPQSIEERERLMNMYGEATNTGYLKNFSPSDAAYVRSTLGFPKDTDMTLARPGVEPGATPGAGDEPANPDPGSPTTEDVTGTKDDPKAAPPDPENRDPLEDFEKINTTGGAGNKSG